MTNIRVVVRNKRTQTGRPVVATVLTSQNGTVHGRANNTMRLDQLQDVNEPDTAVTGAVPKYNADTDKYTIETLEPEDVGILIDPGEY